MRTYTVHAPPQEPPAPERFAFVKDGISWPALFFPVLWILWHRLWLTLIGYVIFVLVCLWAERLLGDDVAAITAILGAILFALEANNIRRLSLERRGWRDLGGTYGANLEGAETRFFESWGKPAGRSPAAERRETIVRPAHPAAEPRDRSDEPIFGLFPEPER